MSNEPSTNTSRETADLLESLGVHRGFLRTTAEGLSDDQARQRSTVSALSVGGIIKHVTATEAEWASFIVDGAAAFGDTDWANADWEFGEGEGAAAEWDDGFSMAPDETLAGLLERYAEVAAHTDSLVAGLADLNAEHELPTAPWFPPGTSWSARRVVLHLIAETAQHAGHADIIRETIDGHKTMG